MNKREIFIPFLVIGLTLLFAGVCVAVFLAEGKSEKWISRKIKIGALLLSLTVFSCNTGNEVVTCYQDVAFKRLWFENETEEGLEINLDTGNVLNGFVSFESDSVYSYKIVDVKNNKNIQSGILQPDKGIFKHKNDKFEVELNKNLRPGKYHLSLFASDVKGQDSINPTSVIKLKILSDK